MFSCDRAIRIGRHSRNAEYPSVRTVARCSSSELRAPRTGRTFKGGGDLLSPTLDELDEPTRNGSGMFDLRATAAGRGTGKRSITPPMLSGYLGRSSKLISRRPNGDIPRRKTPTPLLSLDVPSVSSCPLHGCVSPSIYRRLNGSCFAVLEI